MLWPPARPAWPHGPTAARLQAGGAAATHKASAATQASSAAWCRRQHMKNIATNSHSWCMHHED
eukprot:351628-Chlamydomonas_euryale.AAC.11